MNRKLAANFRNSERGQAIIVIVFAIIGIVGISSLAIDGSNALIDRRKSETAASAAALAGALARIEGRDWRESALAAAKMNGYDNDGENSIVELNTPPINGPYAGDAEYIEVIVTSNMRTYFGSIIGIPVVTSVGYAVAQTKPAEYGQMFDGYALVSLAPHSECDKKKAFWLHNEPTIVLEGGGIFVNSDNDVCAFLQEGSGSIRVQDESPITVVGGASVQKAQLISPAIVQPGAIPISYPPAFQMPKIGCGSKIATIDLVTGTMTSGNYEEPGDFPPEGIHDLESGIYCISGDVVIGGGTRLTGNGVTLIVEQGEVRIAAEAEVDLSAPKNGNAAGLLIYMPLDNHSRIALNGNADSNFTGTILAPSADIRLNGPDSKHGFHSQIIGYYIEVDGQSKIVIKYEDEDNYDAYKMPEVILVQ
ncbi:MAG TPA: pilus assembly protein TadG-related protein [Anaerolineales bacterium]|nr:pilus assembly protein TadG-related protein [Anaerolineales bacterium]HMX75248.1 pilus assembly protein TadG-related protein [Anaerolineales bacterium]HMZ44194.1 pilus assembly protein TadG-related protein [Anaerolineales bacterium]HNA55138.1 pilus assembly protein TadG-related protein [Anaerolineales bacterium]HND92959.1 pilus assembly protein TadG-related protein [Anaerolineales bacterium]